MRTWHQKIVKQKENCKKKIYNNNNKAEKEHYLNIQGIQVDLVYPVLKHHQESEWKLLNYDVLNAINNKELTRMSEKKLLIWCNFLDNLDVTKSI